MGRTKVLEVLEANVGGAQKHVFQILHGLDPGRFELHLACSVERDPSAAAGLDSLRAEGIRVASIRMVRRPSPLSDFRALRALERLMAAEHYDIVHTHASKAGFLGRWAARRAGVPVVIHTPHTFPFQRVDTRLTALYRWLERRAARWTDRIVLLTEGQRELARDARIGAESQYVVIPNGIRVPAEDRDAARRRFRQELGLDEDTPAMAFIGRITPQKDVQTFLSTAAEVLRSLPRATAFLVGAADNRDYLLSLTPGVGAEACSVLVGGEHGSKTLVWSDALPLRVLGHRPDAADLAAAFDAIVLPSRYEGLPYSLLEAMAWAVPVIASDIPGNRDAIEPGRSGLLAAPGDVAEFVKALVNVLGDRDSARKLGAAARERVAAEFTEERFLGRIAGLYDSCSASSSSPETDSGSSRPDRTSAGRREATKSNMP